MKSKLTPLVMTVGMAVMACGAFAKPLDREAVHAISEPLYEVMEQVEQERGRQFVTAEEFSEVTKTPEFQKRLASAMERFCLLPDNSRTLACN